MSAVDEQQAPIPAPGRSPPRPRYLRRILLAISAQYEIVAKFQAIATALKQ
jgi:hypothetical protein